MPEPEQISVVSVGGPGAGRLSGAARQAMEGATTLIGSKRQLALADRLISHDAAPRSRRLRIVETSGDIAAVLRAVEKTDGKACVLASGDPGFFGIVRPLAERFGPECLEVHPGPSSVSLAFARLGLPWDDAVVVSAHGRPLAGAVEAISAHPKVAVLVSSDQPPESLGAELRRCGAGSWPSPPTFAVCSLLGTEDENVARADVDSLADGTWDPLSVVVSLRDEGVRRHPSASWGLPDDLFGHRMITTAEVRGIVVGKLELPPAGVLWDVGAGSGSVAVECARLRPGLRVLAIERRSDDAERIRSNACDHDVVVEVVEDDAMTVISRLPAPDRVFVGGGGVAVLGTVLGRLRPGGRVVATYAALDRAAEAGRRLGSMAEIRVSRGEALPDGGTRLEAENPVFVAWGPRGASQ